MTREVTAANVYESVRLSRAGDLLYLCNYKAACTTLLLCLARREKQLGLIGQLPDADSVHVDDIFAIRHFTLAPSRPFTFSFVKNPYSRVLSAYIDKILVRGDDTRAMFCRQNDLDPSSDISLGEFLRFIRQTPACEHDAHWRKQAHNLLLGGLRIDFVGHVESMAADFSRLTPVVGLNLDDASVRAGRKHGTSASLRFAEFYGKHEIALVAEIYEEDFKVFGYDFDPEQDKPRRSGLQFEITDQALHRFVVGVGSSGTG